MALVKLDETTLLNTDNVELVQQFDDHIGLRLVSGQAIRVEGAAVQIIKDSFIDLVDTELDEEPPETTSFWSRLKGLFRPAP